MKHYIIQKYLLISQYGLLDSHYDNDKKKCTDDFIKVY